MIALYRGHSVTSRLIRWRTWSLYSHAAWMDDDFSVIESWPPKGVKHSPHFASNHLAGTPIDLFEVPLTSGETDGVRGFMLAQVGMGYDWAGVFGFICRRDGAQSRDRWFCSELVFAAFLHIHKPLLARIPAHRVSPGDLALSPLLFEHKTIYCGQPEKGEDHDQLVEPFVIGSDNPFAV